LTLSDEQEKDETATRIEILSDPRSSYLIEQTTLTRALATALRTYEFADAKCASTRTAFYLADLGFQAVNGTECESLKEQYASDVIELQAPHTQACEEEKRIRREWENKLAEAKETQEGFRNAKDLYADL